VTRVYSYLGGEFEDSNVDMTALEDEIWDHFFAASKKETKGASVQDIMDSYEYSGEDPEAIDIDALIAAFFSLLFEQDYASSTDDLSA